MDLINIDIGTAGLIGILGYLVVFIGLILLMLVVVLVGKIMVAQNKKITAVAVAADTSATAEAATVPTAKLASGTAGDIKLYDTDPKDAAMIMAIVADTLGKPLNELRFKSIREVK